MRTNWNLWFHYTNIEGNNCAYIHSTDCGFSAHYRCSEKLPADCCPDLKQLRGVFGIDLTTLVKAHKSTRPFVIDKCIQEIETRGLDAEGLYRVSGYQEEMDNLRMAFEKGTLKFYFCGLFWYCLEIFTSVMECKFHMVDVYLEWPLPSVMEI